MLIRGGSTRPIGGPSNFIKIGEKTSCACTRILHILVLNSYPDLPLSEILYLPLLKYVTPHHQMRHMSQIQKLRF